MVGEQTPEPGIFLLQMKALPAKRIDFGAVSAIAVHQSMIPPAYDCLARLQVWLTPDLNAHPVLGAQRPVQY